MLITGDLLSSSISRNLSTGTTAYPTRHPGMQPELASWMKRAAHLSHSEDTANTCPDCNRR